jgi:hypothetical protein
MSEPSAGRQPLAGGQFTIAGTEAVPQLPKSATVHEPHAVRARLAYGLLILLASVVAIMLAMVEQEIWNGKDWTVLKDLFTLILTPIITLTSTAVGFFYANIIANKD